MTFDVAGFLETLRRGEEHARRRAVAELAASGRSEAIAPLLVAVGDESWAVRQAAVTEAWQEKGQDFVTVYCLASLVDYTTDESGSQVLEGSRTEPVKFEEYWTFTRPVGPNAWKLSAIQQPA